MKETTTSIKQAKEIIRLAPVETPVCLHGAGGVGKTQAVKQVCKEEGYYLEVLTLSLYEGVDLRGVPYKDGDTMRWSIPAFIKRCQDAAENKRYKGVVLFVDELNCALPSIQAIAYRLILEGKIEEHTLPEDCKRIAACNTAESSNAVFEMPSPLKRRFIHLIVEPTLEEFIQYAAKNGWNYMIPAFLQTASQHLIAASDGVFGQACPRTWEFVNLWLQKKEMRNDSHFVLRRVLIGALGEGIALEFLKFKALESKVPKTEDWLAGKAEWPLKNREPVRDVLFCVISSLAVYTLKCDKLEGLLQVLPKRLETERQRGNVDEFVISFLRTILSERKILESVVSLPAWESLLDSLGGLLLGE